MSESVECPDWLGGEEQPTHTPEDIERLWRRFLAENLVGRKVQFANHGGDMGRLEGIIASVEETKDGIVIKARCVKLYHEGAEEDELVEEWPEEEFVLAMEEPPEFSEGRTIVLPSGLKNIVNMSIGFVL